MRQILLVIRNGAFAAAIAVGLALGATQALSGTPNPAVLRAPCESPPGTCPDPIDDCNDYCSKIDPEWTGYCAEPPNCCVCQH